jgi:hypothetical protein
MRTDGDDRNDGIIKTEIFDKYIRNIYNVIAVFDDRDSVVKAWRNIGLLCLQVNYGDF